MVRPIVQVGDRVIGKLKNTVVGLPTILNKPSVFRKVPETRNLT